MTTDHRVTPRRRGRLLVRIAVLLLLLVAVVEVAYRVRLVARRDDRANREGAESTSYAVTLAGGRRVSDAPGAIAQVHHPYLV
jgi:hypothetical protein